MPTIFTDSEKDKYFLINRIRKKKKKDCSPKLDTDKKIRTHLESWNLLDSGQVGEFLVCIFPHNPSSNEHNVFTLYKQTFSQLHLKGLPRTFLLRQFSPPGEVKLQRGLLICKVNKSLPFLNE